MTSEVARRTDRRLRIATWIAGGCVVAAVLSFMEAFGMSWFASFRAPDATREARIFALAIASLIVLAIGAPTWITLVVVRLARWAKARGSRLTS